MIRALLYLAFLCAALPLHAESRVTCTLERGNGVANFVAHNDTECPAVITVTITSLTNGTASPGRTASALVNPHARVVLVRASRVNPRAGWYYYWKYTTYFGAPVQAARAWKYRYPFDLATPRRVGQGNNGTFTHHGAEAYAFDFDMPEGTRVLAARNGRVGYVIDTYQGGGTTEYYRTRCNEIILVHDDGTISRYAHLRHGGAAVREGQLVSAGQLIGYSGNTGFSSRPHLHFDVRVAPLYREAHTIPARFDDGSVAGVVPVMGRYWPGGAIATRTTTRRRG